MDAAPLPALPVSPRSVDVTSITVGLHTLMTLDTVWLIIGFLGQGVFFMRWVVQWIASEKHAESRVPTAFWYMSLVGGLITLAYAIYRLDPVFIAGQSIGSVVYLRNLMLIHRPNPTDSNPASPATKS
ncbi:MAG: lipid-A-disaccharide synthase N-terminal domain-containing protein [Nitrospira sp.]